MLSRPFLHANLSFQFVNFSFVLSLEVSSPSCLKSPLRRSMFTELHLTVASVWQLSPFHMDPFRKPDHHWSPAGDITAADFTKACKVSVCFTFRSQYISSGGKMLGFFTLNLFQWRSFGLNTMYGWVLQTSCCPGWEWSAWGWWELLKLALLLLEIHFAITLSENCI